MSEESAPDLRAVIDRFNSSRDTLDQLGERLRALTLAEQTSTQAAESITTAAERLAETASQLQGLTQAALAAQEQLQAAVQAAADFLQATDLSELTRTLQTIDAATGQALPELVRSATEGAASRIEGRLETVEQRLTELENLRQREDRLRRQLDNVRAQLPARKLQKLGLTPMS